MRIELIEYGAGIELKHLEIHCDSSQELNDSIAAANKRICRKLGLQKNPLVISDGRLRVCGIAGMVRLTKSIEIEVVPKFLSHVKNTSWKETLYLLSVLSKHGGILTNERILSSTSYIASLYDIAGRILAQEFQKNRRKPIRKYRKDSFCDFSIDGDIDFTSVLERNDDGIKQSRIRFDIYNEYNAVISKAMKTVIPYTSDNQARNVLQSAIGMFGKQAEPVREKMRVPVRNKEWEDAYALSYDIINGLANSFDAGKILAPGFVVSTWQLWEWLITTGLSLANVPGTVKPQTPVKWGNKKVGSQSYSVNVYPDVEILDANSHQVLYLVDAKYKVLTNQATGEANRDDIYEAFAFCSATNTNTLFLAYPGDSGSANSAGNVTQQSFYEIGSKKIFVVTVDFGTISTRGGLFAFGHNLNLGLNTIFHAHT